ncbi:MIP/aquaporin family protein [Protaetiibacter mangrovi]|uniref:Aquaporin family protein n=1 Tax=Protaetiibacter mangrovi TaxID=2970926 RepID=A0ABT1ZCY9_9MICO|nr:MIP/aquaporin family protein [Protaetiibacter mangrovi]MCS0498563.1 aquaporin family protein [Protaetiibacter mangrovi]
MTSLPRRLLAEFLGTALLVAVVIGSGVAASRLSPADAGLQLLENALATAMGLAVLIAVLQPISGAHLNPVVSLVDLAVGRRPWADALGYLPAQLAGGVAGAVLANAMFGAPTTISTTHRLSWQHALAEVVATAGLVLVIFVLARTGRGAWAAPAVGAYIGAAYFFTSSTSFANPAVTLGRVFSDTFAGIDPASALGFAAAQLVGGGVGLGLVLLLAPERR